MKLSFKRDKAETGLRTISTPHPNVFIKGDKKIVGWIQAKSRWTESYEIWFHVENEDKESNSPFRNIKLAYKCDTEEEARAFVKRTWAEIERRFKLYKMED